MNTPLPHTTFFLPPPFSENSGVDFLGLRQANLDMMADLIPGTNNVTSYIRPFSLLSWIFWKFHELCEREGRHAPTNIAARSFRERIEVLFTWGARLADAPDIPGKTAEPPSTADGTVELTFDAWGRVQTSTSLIAALWYGPASKTVSGLGFLCALRPELFRTSGHGVALARALDLVLRQDGALYNRLLDTLLPVRASADDAAALWKLWGVDNITGAERVEFREALFDEAAVGSYVEPLGKRSSTIALARLHLASIGEISSPDEVRRGMYYTRGATESYSVPEELILARKKWITLQVRQLQRLALETLLSWIEYKILSGKHDTASITFDALTAFNDGEFGLPANGTVRALLDILDKKASSIEEFATAGQSNPLLCPFTQMELIHVRPTEMSDDVAARCLYGVFLCGAFAGCAQDEDKHLVGVGGPYRLSLLNLRKRLIAIADIALHQAIQFILEALVISQHMATAVNRFDGQNQRLRISIEETGLEVLVSKPWEPTVTEDRLPTILRLCFDCGVIQQKT